MAVQINPDTFGKRVKLLYDGWKDNRADIWDNANALAVVVGGTSDDLRYLKSISLHLWLFGYELPDTIMVFTDAALHILTSGKKAALLEPLKDVLQSSAAAELKIIVRSKDQQQQQMGALLDSEQHSGQLAELWGQQLADSGLTTCDATAGFADLFSVKDDGEVLNAKKAAFLASKVMQSFVVEKIEDIIDKNKKVKHTKLSEMTEEVILDPPKVGIKLKAENVDIAYPPLFQSGGNYDLKLNAACDDNALHDGVILVSLGTRYQSYCANVSRTYIINPNKAQEAQYAALLAAHEAACAALKEGQPARASMEAAVKTLQEKAPELVERLNKNVGFGMGLEFREGANVFTVSLGVSGLENADASGTRAKTYALQVADTLVVKPSGAAPENLCGAATKLWDKVSYILNDDQEDDVPDVLEEVSNGNVMPGGKKLRSDDPNFKSSEQMRREKQEDLLKQKNEETLRRLTAQAAGVAESAERNKVRQISQVKAYESIDKLPTLNQLHIAVDSKAEAVFVPIYGVLVPLHITSVRNVVHTQEAEGNGAVVRLSLNFGTTYEPAQKFPQLIFLKELSFRTSDAKHAARVVQEVKVLRSTVLQRDKERAERATLVSQDKLVRGKRVFRLPDLWVRPVLGGKGRKMPGTLEAHQNGFRCGPWRAAAGQPQGEGIDVMYRNIRYAFFQPAENDMITILHFHLMHPIMIGNKKCKDVQFYCEVVDLEHWERDFAELQLEFDIPFRELGFEGVPHRETVLVLPTVNCLVELSQMPFTVVALGDIEIINLERVGFNLKNFDMAIVFKDFSREVLRIDAIPSKKLDTIKEWLTSVKIKYYESKMNLAWKPILKAILEDPNAFIEQGGWAFLDLDKSDGEDEDEEASSEGFNPGSDAEEEEEESSEDISDEDASVVDSEEVAEEASEEEEESEGMTWEELEEEAKK
ncbi:global transcription factor [Scenedesmus sp. NREL 46B-D3]|nr:global transcription factor [Scenedesmus sp. NREL 46B-D3]